MSVKPKLNQNQEKAVTMDLGPAMVLAGPGSGKTTVVLERIRHLIFEKHINPKEILVITFTKSAAIEMKERAVSVIKNSINVPFFGTFHSYFYTVLKQSNRFRNYTILTIKEKYQTLESLLNIHFPNYRISQNLLSDLLKCFSKYKNDMDITKDMESLGFSEADFSCLIETYDYFNREKFKMDFDDILLYSLELFNADKTFLKKVKGGVRYILVDEFQDVNKVQYELIRLLSGNAGNVFVVGDDDQSIYRFRGAGEENLRRFATDFTDVKKITLDVNYRCPKAIVDTALMLIQNNKQRFFKEIHSAKSGYGRVFCQGFENKEKERAFVVDILKSHNKSGKTALLCRTNSQLGSFAELLKRDKVPFVMKEKVVNFYELPCIRPVVGYLMFATGLDRSRKRLFSFLNQPARYIKREYFADWNEKYSRLGDVLMENAGTDTMHKKLQSDLEKLRGFTPKMAVNYILKVMGYESFKLQECRTEKEVMHLKEVFTELKERAGMFENLREWMEIILWQENREEQEKYCETKENTNLYLYTFHGAKGLEFDTVVIPHLNEGSVPYGKELSEEELEEERRMFYVALTRSSGSVYVTYTENESKKDTVSRFIKEAGLTASKVTI